MPVGPGKTHARPDQTFKGASGYAVPQLHHVLNYVYIIYVGYSYKYDRRVPLRPMTQLASHNASALDTRDSRSFPVGVLDGIGN
jgi:hypothetical protein